jgi:hypothetical protein
VHLQSLSKTNIISNKVTSCSDLKEDKAGVNSLAMKHKSVNSMVIDDSEDWKAQTIIVSLSKHG